MLGVKYTEFYLLALTSLQGCGCVPAPADALLRLRSLAAASRLLPPIAYTLPVGGEPTQRCRTATAAAALWPLPGGGRSPRALPGSQMQGAPGIIPLQ